MGEEDKRGKTTHNGITHDGDTLGRGKSDQGFYQKLGSTKAATVRARRPFCSRTPSRGEKRAFHFSAHSRLATAPTQAPLFSDLK